MYLAILAGGQILQKIIKKTLRLKTGEGVAIFSFDGHSKTELKKQFMERINQLELSSSEKEAIVQEKIRVFKMNNEVANHLEIPFKSYTKIGICAALIVVIFCAFVLFLLS